jgi:cytochrome c oxidase subunit 2
MTSKDVLHSFFIPALRIKQDVIPGRYTSLWFEAEKLGDYQVFCTEYCGAEHSGMLATMKVVSQEEFDEWLADDPMKQYEGMTLAQMGEKVMNVKACIACHNLNTEERKIGPGFKNLYGAKRAFTDGSTAIANDDYIRQSIKEPAAKIVSGYQNQMNMIPVNEEELTAIIEYMKSVSSN